MDKVRVSIIIPVYNCEEYLEQCLDSVIRQTLRPLEIICVDDGSVDNSYKILQNYVARYDFIHVYAQENSGAGIARNLGIEKSSGEFVCFLDSDDYYLDEEALEKMYATCVEKEVRVCGSNPIILRNGKETQERIISDNDSKGDENDILEYRDFQFDYWYCCFMFSREMLIQNKIKFPHYRRFQDPPFLIKAMDTAGQFALCKTALWCYREPIVSSRFNKQKVHDLLSGIRDNLIFAKEKNLDKLFDRTLMRLEYEYYSVICHWLGIKDIESVGLLQDIQNIVRKYLNEETYALRPLECILHNEKSDKSYADEVCDSISRLPYIYIYGAGKLAKKFIDFLEEKDLLHKVKGILVSKASETREYLSGIEIIVVDELMEGSSEMIYIATGGGFHKEIIETLNRRGNSKYEAVDTVFLEEI